jgi:hypothetical protein
VYVLSPEIEIEEREREREKESFGTCLKYV